jgi:hypothetical protein
MKLLPWSVSISLGIPTLENKLITALGHIRGPLAVLKEEWEEPSTCQNSALSHLLDTREKMKTMAELATENEKQAK